MKTCRSPGPTQIAVSVFFGVLTLALCVLWVRSYTWYDFDFINLTASTDAHISSYQGSVAVAFVPSGFTTGNFNGSWQGGNVKASLLPWTKLSSNQNGRNSQRWLPIPEDSFAVPYWLLTASCIAVVVAPWTATRFSLRSILIATTLVAVVLGLGVWLSR